MPKKVEQYDAERRVVLDRMFEILGISESNKTICLNDIDKDEAKLKAIDNLDVDIKKYFLTSGWNCYSRHNVKRKYYSLLKYLLRELSIEYKESKMKQIKMLEDGSSKSSTIINVTINN